MTAESGYYISHVYVDGEDQGKVSSYNFTNVQSNHTISVSSATIVPTNGSTPTPSPTPTPSSLTPQPTETSETSPFPTETALIAAVAIATIIVVLALAFKKGYITIETVEESPEETPEDYNI